MNTNIKATNTTLTPSIEEYIAKKTAALDKLIHPEDTSSMLHIELGKSTEHHKSGDIFFAEFNLHIAGKDLRARQESSDLFAAIDLAKDELVHGLRTYKGKRQTLLRRGSQRVKDMMRGMNWRKPGM
jgi:ribosomal subunit interface protein